jgi:phosphate transport system permease protein
MTDTAPPPAPTPPRKVTDWAGPVMQARVRKRYAAERRFKAFGLIAVLISVGFLAFLLVTMAAAGASGFRETRISLPIDMGRSVIGIDAARLDGPEASAMLAQADLPNVIAAAAMQTYGPGAEAWFGPAATSALGEAIIADPERLSGTQTFTLPAAAAIDVAAKGAGDPASEAAVARLTRADALSSGFATRFFTSADATDPTIAGIWGALKGSLLTMAVTLALAFPVGALAAVYLEEYAPRNRFTDIIEVSINNLAAVPSIIFGLLALALFINVFGLCQGSPLVGGLTLALMTMPVIVIAGRNAIKAVPPSIRDAALGVGASKVQVVFHHVLPLALPGILTGTIIGAARALGETAPLLLIGMRAFIGGAPDGFCSSATVLPMQIYLWSDEVDRGFIENTSAAIIVLLVVLLSMNAFAIYLRNRFEQRW